MNFPAKCHCGFYHYTLQQWSEVHGQGKPFIDPYIQMSFVGDELWNESDYDYTEPYPTITKKWVCQFCGIGNNNHTAECDYYLNYIKRWEDIKGGIASTTYSHTPKNPKKEPKKDDETETKKTLKGWYDINQVSKIQYLQLVNIVVKNAKYTLTQLLSFLPKTKPSSPPLSPQTDPTDRDEFLEELQKADSELTKLFRDYTELMPHWNPTDEINEKGKGDWDNKNWKEYLSTANDVIDVDYNKNNILDIFGQVMINHFLDNRDLEEIDKFITKHPNISDYKKFEDRINKLREEKNQPDLLEYLKGVEKDNKEYVEKGTISPDLETYWYRVDEQLKKLAEWDAEPTLIKTNLENLFIKIKPFAIILIGDKPTRHKQIGEKIQGIVDELWVNIKKEFKKEIETKYDLTEISFVLDNELKKLTGKKHEYNGRDYIDNATEKDWQQVKDNLLSIIAKLPRLKEVAYKFNGLDYWKKMDDLDEYLKIAISPAEKNVLENEPTKSLIKEIRDNPPFPREVEAKYKNIKTWEQFVKVFYPTKASREQETKLVIYHLTDKFVHFLRTEPKEGALTAVDGMLDLSEFTNLKEFNPHKLIIFNQINIRNNSQLNQLVIEYNLKLKNIDTRNNLLLKNLNLRHCESLKSIDFSQNINLSELRVENIGITELDLSNTKITEFDYKNYNYRDGIWHVLYTDLPKDKIIFSGQTKSTWDDVLDKIYNKFIGSDKPKTLTQVKEFVDKELKTLPKSGMEGDIKQAETKKEDLLKLKKGSADTQLVNGKGEFVDYQTWTPLDSNRDGNCFLNSFSLLMKGDQSLSTELRVRMCIFLMNNPNLMGAIEEKDQLALLIDKLTVNKDGDKKWPLAKKGEWLFTDDIKFISEMLARPIRVIYKPHHASFKDWDTWTEFNKITGGWAKLEYYEPEKKTYKSDNWWTICHVSGNHFEPLIPPHEDKAEPPTELNLIFQKLNNGVNGVINGDVPQSNYLMSKDFENALKLLDKETYRVEIKQKIKDAINRIVGIKRPIDPNWYGKLPLNVRTTITKLKEIGKEYKYAEPNTFSENYVDIYFSADTASAHGRLVNIKVSPRPDGNIHKIGEAWKNDGSFLNVYEESDDVGAGKYKGKEISTISFNASDEKWANKLTQQINSRGSKHIIFRVKGEMDENCLFNEEPEINIEVLLPL